MKNSPPQTALCRQPSAELAEAGVAQSCKNWVGKTSNFDNIFRGIYKLHKFYNFEGFFPSDH